jgi:TetR/AcrR family transcriptional regulator, tetracycline repressor protein
MPRQPARRPEPLTVDVIVDAAVALLADVGLSGLSMRKLGAALDVDPMAVYHHVGSKRALLALVTTRVLGRMQAPDPDAAWPDRIRQWALRYWDVVVANRELTMAGLADPEIAEGGMPMVGPLIDAVTASGLPDALVTPNVYLVVDAVHGAALGASAPRRHATDDLADLRSVFAAGVDTVVAGIAATAGQNTRAGEFPQSVVFEC